MLHALLLTRVKEIVSPLIAPVRAVTVEKQPSRSIIGSKRTQPAKAKAGNHFQAKNLPRSIFYRSENVQSAFPRHGPQPAKCKTTGWILVGCLSAPSKAQPEGAVIPVFGLDTAKPIDTTNLVAWVNRHKLDLVVSDRGLVSRKKEGLQISFVRLYSHEIQLPGGGAIRRDFQSLGDAAIHSLLSDLILNRRGLPSRPSTQLIDCELLVRAGGCSPVR
jgi:hypothetical protein